MWNILTEEGFNASTVGWFFSHPAEPISGVCVSDRFGKLIPERENPRALESAGRHRAAGRAHRNAGRLEGPSIGPDAGANPAIHSGGGEDLSKSGPAATGFAKILCECVNIHSAATWIMRHHPWEFMGIYFTAIDHFGHAFMRYHPPQMTGVSDQDFEISNTPSQAAIASTA